MKKNKLLNLTIILILGIVSNLQASELVRMCHFKNDGLSTSSTSPSCPSEGVVFFGGPGCDNQFYMHIYFANLSGFNNPPNPNSTYHLPPAMPNFYVYLDTDFDGIEDEYIGPINGFQYANLDIPGTNGGTHYIFKHEIDLSPYLVDFNPCRNNVPPGYDGFLNCRFVQKTQYGPVLYDLQPFSAYEDVVSCDVFEETCGYCTPQICNVTDPIYEAEICEDCTTPCNNNNNGPNTYSIPNNNAIPTFKNNNVIPTFKNNKISPNPFKDELNIEFETSSDESISIQIYNISGSLVFENSFDVEKGLITKNLNLKNLPTGIYYCKLASKNSNQTFKVIKM